MNFAFFSESMLTNFLNKKISETTEAVQRKSSNTISSHKRADGLICWGRTTLRRILQTRSLAEPAQNSFGGKNLGCLILDEQQYFVWDTASQSTKMTRSVVVKVFFIFLPYKPKHCQFLPNKNHKQDNCKNFTLPTVKIQQTIMNQTDSYDVNHGGPQQFFQGGKADILLIFLWLLTMQRKFT